MSQLQVEIDASNSTMSKIMTTIRKRIGFSAIEKNANQQLLDTGRKLEDFYEVKKIPMEVKKSVEVEGKGGKGKKGKKGKQGGATAEKGKSTKKVVTVTEEKDAVYVKDVPQFVEHVIKERGLDPAKTTVRIGLDGGQNTFKVMASIFDDSESSDDGDDDDGDGANVGSNDCGQSDSNGPKPSFKPKLNSGSTSCYQ